MGDRVEEALNEVLDRIDAGEEISEAGVRERHPDCWREVLDALAVSQMLHATPATVGPYRVISLLGRGGMGAVYLAEDPSGAGRVAVKVLAPGLAGSERALRRFRREAAAAARIEHPGICPILDAGVADGEPYLVMRHVEGTTLDSLVAAARGGDAANASEVRARGPVELPAAPGQTSDPVARVLLLGERAARALHAAHEAGLTHRDIKPGNVIVTPAGEPVILDFGLARDDMADAITRTGALLGTPAYMAPEQIVGRGAAHDHRADVYALGVTLFECLSLSRPFEAPTREALFASILRDEPAELRRLVPGLSRDAALVVATAMAKEPDARYQTALDFAEDLMRAREGRPIRARLASPFVRLRRFCRRRPGVAAAAAIAFGLLATALGAALWTLGVTTRAAEDVRHQLDHTRALAFANASKAAQDVDPMRALLLAKEASAIEMSPDVVSQLHSALACSLEDRILRVNTRAASSAAYSPSSRSSPSNDRILVASMDGIARIWASGEKPLVELRGHTRGLTSAIWSPSGDRILTTSVDGTARIWSADGVLLATLPHGDIVTGAVFSGAGDRIVTASADGTVRMWTADGQPIAVLARDAGRAYTLVRAADDDVYAAGSSDGHVRIWDGRGKLLADLPHRGPVFAVALSPDGTSIIYGGEPGLVQRWDLALSPTRKVSHRKSYVTSAAWAPNGEMFVVGFDDGIAELHDAEGALRAVLRGHTSSVGAAAFSHDSLLVATSGHWDNTVRVWDKQGACVAVLRGHTSAVHGVSFSPNDRRLMTSSEDGTARTWRVKGAEAETFRSVAWGEHPKFVYGIGAERILVIPTSGPASLLDREGKPIRTYGEPADCLTSASISPDGRRVVIADAKGILRLYEGEDPEPSVRIEAHRRECWATFSPDGTRILSWSADRTVCLWDLDGKKLQDFLGHEERVQSAAFSRNGQIVATGDWDGRVRLFDVGSETARVTLPVRWDAVFGVVFAHHTDRLLIVGHGDHAVDLCRPDGKLIHRFLHASDTNVAAFSPDDRLIAVGCSDGSTWLWNTETGEQIAQLFGHSALVVAAEFDSSGSMVCTACADGNIRVRFVSDADVLAAVQSRISREFTHAELDQYEALFVHEHDTLRDAYTLVEPLLARCALVEDVTAEVGADPAIAADVRAAALRILDRQHDDPDRARRRAWQVVRQAGRDPAEYSRARRWAEASDEMWHENPAVGVALALALHRTGDDASAEKVLDECVRRTEGDDWRLATAAVRMLVQHATGRAEEARSSDAKLECMRGALDAPEFARVRPVLEEALAAAGTGQPQR
jgi:WD40 repeat protein/serine/threonine protein kinase